MLPSGTTCPAPQQYQAPIVAPYRRGGLSVCAGGLVLYWKLVMVGIVWLLLLAILTTWGLAEWASAHRDDAACPAKE